MLFALAALSLSPAHAEPSADANNIIVPVNRSTLLTMASPMSEVMVANPDIADVHAHNPTNLTVVGKKLGHTNLRIFSAEGELLREVEVTVAYDLPAVRRALKNFLPKETIGVEMVNTSIALTGQISGGAASEQAIKIVRDFIQAGKKDSEKNKPGADKQEEVPEILNMMRIASGQQVMLRVRVGEINREALKRLGVDLSNVDLGGAATVLMGTGAGTPAFFSPLDGSEVRTPGSFILTDPLADTNTPRGVLIGRYAKDNYSIGGMIRALERDGLFKLLAEPNLIAVSGEEAEFLAGGEIPIPVVQGNNGSVSIEYKPFGVGVKFAPMVLSENRIRMAVLPEVSEISNDNAVTISGFTIPSLTTRRAKTTVEMAPGESFMIAGLIKDDMRATIDQLPGVKEVPVLGALFRSTEFQRNETELVIAVTPYLVDPMKSADVKLPTDDYRPASQMEMFFYGALGTLSGDARTISQTPPVEGPIGFMVD